MLILHIQDLSEPDLNTPGSLSHISFGALASAQLASLSSNKKRKRSAMEAHDRTASRSPSPFHEAEERRAGAKASSSAGRDSARASKHAPTEQSSKKAVSRKRTVISVSTPAARDPRFSSLSGHLGDSQALERRYGFLDEYRKTELAALKKSLRETRDERAKDRLQREIKVMEDRQKTKNRAEAENEVRREHRRLEKDRVKEGKQPYFLKQSEVKKRLLEKQFEELGEKKAARAMERRRRKQTAKERRDLPRTRRDYSFAGPD